MIGASQFNRAADDALRLPDVQELREQLERLERQKHDAAVLKEAEIIKAGMRKRIRELGAEPCA